MIALVNGVGAGEYSDPSRAVVAHARRSLAAPSLSLKKPVLDTTRQRRIDPKIARARIAVREGREKRQRLNLLMKAEAQRHAASVKQARRRAQSLATVSEEEVRGAYPQADTKDDLVAAIESGDETADESIGDPSKFRHEFDADGFAIPAAMAPPQDAGEMLSSQPE